jgi:uncharacterized protein (DUF58 family)
MSQGETALLKKIRIAAGKKVTGLLSGEYHSAFRGHGINFDAVREYQYGDDVRSIDWNVSSRMDHLYIKEYVEERELSIVLMVDMSASTRFASSARKKSDVVLELSALLLNLAGLNNDRVSVALFTERLEKYYKPQKGRKKAMRILNDILSFTPAGKGTSIINAIEEVSKIQKKRSIFFIISDFLDPDPMVENRIKHLARRHDVILVRVDDPGEKGLPMTGLINLYDMETGDVFLTETASLESGKMDLDFLSISTGDSIEQKILSYFMKRNRAMRHNR